MPDQCKCNSNESENGTPSAQPLKLTEMVAYAEGSIVSRTLGETAGGTVTLFAFDAGQGLSEHSAPFDAMVQVLDGTVELVIGGKSIQAAAGELVVMPANVPHAVRATTQFKMLLTMLKK